MNARLAEINALAEQNVAKVIADGPGLRSDYNVWVVARHRSRRLVLLGGLGAMGCGQMWLPQDPRHASYHGWIGAPEQDSGLGDPQDQPI